SKDAPIENLGQKEPGNVAFKKALGKAGLTARGAGKAPGYKTVADPTDVVTQKTSKGNTMLHGEELKNDEALVDETKEEEVVEETEAKNAKLKEDLANDVTNLFSGETDLTEEFKAKAVSLFEAAVMARVANEVSLLEDAIAEKAVELIAENEMALAEKIDNYLSYVAEEWVEQNELGVSNMLRTEIAESFMESLRTAFAENYIDIPDEKFNVVDEMQEALETLEAERDQIIEDANALAEELIDMKRHAIILTVTEGLAKTQVEKFSTLVEEVTYEDDTSFSEKLEIVKKNLFNTPSEKIASFVDGEGETVIAEERNTDIDKLLDRISDGSGRF
ncbi:MAG TPA: hypothetical protein VJ044_00800, partial [Candidatus Hodarchaeales archaeon]|nr:hypothetical protein [Candidatus Hodarchaeales archaeon]